MPQKEVAAAVGQSFTDFLLHLADDSLINSQRLSAWTGHGPVLEQDIAMTNIALDYLGQARLLYQYAASCIGGETTEDSLAMFRLEREFKNHMLVEQPNGDWAQSILKVFLFSHYQQLLFGQLLHAPDETIQGIAAKSLKEVAYHTRWSKDWVLRLGDGTEESHRRLKAALEALWIFTGELFEAPSYQLGWVDYSVMQAQWIEHIDSILQEANLPGYGKDALAGSFQRGGIEGKHTEHLGYVLAEMQYVQRAYPGSTW